MNPSEVAALRMGDEEGQSEERCYEARRDGEAAPPPPICEQRGHRAEKHHSTAKDGETEYARLGIVRVHRVMTAYHEREDANHSQGQDYEEQLPVVHALIRG